MSNVIKRHFYNGIHYKINKEQKTVKLLPDFHHQLKNNLLWNKFGFKKVGGSSVGDILIKGGFNSSFAAFCRLSWIGLPILDRKYVDAGIAIEPKVINLLEEKLALDYQKPIKIQTFDPEKYNYDVFDSHEIVGGIPDGFIEELSTIIEIKTTNEKNYENWQKYGLPESYKRQAQLYAYLIGAKHYSIVATFLKDQDYHQPAEFDIFKRKVKNWTFSLDANVARDDVEKITNWYQNLTILGVSPEYDEVKDADLLAWLECQNAQEWDLLKEKWISMGKLII